MSHSHSKPGPFGVARAVQPYDSSSSAEHTLFTREFSLTDRVALVSGGRRGGRRGIGLEAAFTLAEAGARAVYCLDVTQDPGEDWTKVSELATRMGLGKFEYVQGDVRDQEAMWRVGETIGDREGRLDVCVASAGILGEVTSSLEYNAQTFQDVSVLHTAQAAGRQMARFGRGGSIIMIASLCGSVAVEPTVCNVAYHSSKSGVLQLARSMACELGLKGIRVNTVSPGVFKTPLVELCEKDCPEMVATFASANPLGRLAHTHELRGVFAWLASDASSYCTGTDILVDGGHHAW